MSKNSSILLVYVPCPSPRVAKKIARAMLIARLAACANILPQISSLYLWKGKIKSDRESLLLLKTHPKKWGKLRAEIERLHPYTVPCIAGYKSKHLNDLYYKWVASQVGNPRGKTQ